MPRFAKKSSAKTENTVAKTFKFRLAPSRAEAVLLAKHAGASRFIWNLGLAYLQKRRAEGKKHVGYADKEDGLSKWFTELRRGKEYPWLRKLSSKAIRHSLIRLDTAYGAAFDRLEKIREKKSGEDAGFPVFHSKRADESFTLQRSDKSSSFHLGGRGLYLQKIGWVRMRPNRGRGGCEVEGKAKLVVVKREGGKWYASIQCETAPPEKQPHAGREVGIDMGIANSYALHGKDGEKLMHLWDYANAGKRDRNTETEANAEKRLARRDEKRRARHKRMTARRQAAAAKRGAEFSPPESFEEYITAVKMERKAKNARRRETAEAAAAHQRKVFNYADYLKNERLLRLEARRRRYQRIMARRQNAALTNNAGWDGKSETRGAAEQKLGKLRKRRAAKTGVYAPKYSRRHDGAAARAAKAARTLKNIRFAALHRMSSEIVRDYGLIFVEDLHIKKMSQKAKTGKKAQKRQLNRGILEQGWGMMRGMLKYKSAWRGGYMEAVPPQYTSRECSACGYVHEDNRNGREFRCIQCGYAKDADLNAAAVILEKGLTQGHRASARGEGGNSQSENRETSILQGRKKRKLPGKQTGKTSPASWTPLQNG